jgi:hypothetical protein
MSLNWTTATPGQCTTSLNWQRHVSATSDCMYQKYQKKLYCISYYAFYRDFGKSLCIYKRCWEWCPRASVQAWTRLILFANTFCRSACEMFLMYAVIAVFNSLSVRGWSQYTAAWLVQHSEFPNSLYTHNWISDLKIIIFCNVKITEFLLRDLSLLSNSGFCWLFASFSPWWWPHSLIEIFYRNIKRTVILYSVIIAGF